MGKIGNPISEIGKQMNWEDVRIFLAVARRGSLSGAGEMLGMSASTISRHIDDLETRLGARLFLRSQAGYALSDAGLAIIPDAERAEGALDAVQRKASGAASTVSGTVRIAMPDNFAVSLILPEIARFRRRHNEIALEIVTSIGIASLTRREADIGMRLVRPESGNFVMSRVGTMASALYASANYIAAQPFDQLGRGEGHVLVGWDEAYSGLEAARWADQMLPRAARAIRTTSLQSQLAACAAGAGLAVLPCLLGDASPTLVRLRPPQTVFTQDIWLVTHHDIAGTARIRAATEFLRETVQANRDRLLGLNRD